MKLEFSPDSLFPLCNCNIKILCMKTSSCCVITAVHSDSDT